MAEDVRGVVLLLESLEARKAGSVDGREILVAVGKVDVAVELNVILACDELDRYRI